MCLINKSGFTLIEFCIAVLIMMVGLLGLLQAVNMATEHNLGSLLRNEAISLADEKMVEAKILPFANLVSDASYINRRTRGGFKNYSVVRTTQPSRTVEYPPGVYTVTSQEVSVRVSWRYKGTQLSHTVSTLITNPAQ
ncbi:MAG: prepilin-type cleavage/methylation domain-containing protein [Geobacter sp.]|nr:prepilin-type cleavage/methylation domain-containing protein [Geobacter sp.]